MSFKTTTTVILLVLAALVLGNFLFRLPAGLIVIAAVIGAFLIWRAHREEAKSSGAGAGSDLQPETEEVVPDWVLSCRRLVELNFALREGSASPFSTAAVEDSIDRLRELLPVLDTANVGPDLHWTVNRMAQDYLPRVVDPFLRLSPEQRADREPELLESLQGLRAELSNVEEIVNARREGEFEAKAAFLRSRFLDAGETNRS